MLEHKKKKKECRLICQNLGQCWKVSFSTNLLLCPPPASLLLGSGPPKSYHASAFEQVHLLPSGGWSPAIHRSKPATRCLHIGPLSPEPPPGCSSESQVPFHEVANCQLINHRAWDLDRNDHFFSF